MMNSIPARFYKNYGLFALSHSHESVEPLLCFGYLEVLLKFCTKLQWKRFRFFTLELESSSSGNL